MNEEKSMNEKYEKLGFFKQIWYSIIKFEKYPEMAVLGVKKAIIYLLKITIIFSILYTMIYIYYVSNVEQFEDENLSLSEKIVNQLINVEDYNNETISESIEILKNYPGSLMVVELSISLFIALFLTAILDVLTLSVFGLITCLIVKIKMNYKAIFNMSIFALTLPTILRIIYYAVTLLTEFKIKYFDVMYTAISYITLAAAIFMIKSDIMKQHIELIKIIEESKEKIERTITIPKNPKDEEKEDDEDNKENKEEKDKTEGQESNA